MKKNIICVMLLSVCLSVTACGADETKQVEESSPAEVSNADGLVNEDEENIEENTEVVDEETNADITDLSVVYNAYADFLESEKLTEYMDAGTYSTGSNQIVYQFVYFNHDSIPDLMYGTSECVHAASIYVLTYVNGEVKQLGPYGENNGFSFFEGTGVYASSWFGGGYDELHYYQINDDGSVECLGGYSKELDDMTDEPISEEYLIGDNEVTEDEFFEYRDKFLNNAEDIWFDTYENEKGYDVLSTEEIAKIRQMEL